MSSSDAFTETFAALHAMLERRRRRYLNIFYANLLLAFLILLATVLFPRSSLSFLALLVHQPHSISGGEVASFVFFGCFCGVALICTPILHYSGGFKAEYSLSRMVLLRIAEMLGDCSLASPAISFAHTVRDSGLVAANAGISERAGISGVAGETVFSIGEMAVADEQGCQFRGLVILCNTRRRVGFMGVKGRRATLHHPSHTTPEALVSAGWERAEYVNAALLNGFNLAALATHKEAVEPLLSADFVESLVELAGFAAALPEARKSAGGVLINALRRKRYAMREWFAAKSERPALSAEIEYDGQFTLAPDMERAQALSSSPFAISFAAALWPEACLIMLPSQAPVFAPGSLFDPSFNEAYAGFLQHTVSWIRRISLPYLP